MTFRSPTQYTHVMAFQVPWHAELAGDNECAIRTWAIDSSNYLKLVWAPRTILLADAVISSVSTTQVIATTSCFTPSMVGAQIKCTTSGRYYTISAVAANPSNTATVSTRTDYTVQYNPSARSETGHFSVVSLKGQFQVKRYSGGALQTIDIATTDMYFTKGAIIWVTVEIDGTNVRLSAEASGQAWVHATAGTSMAGMVNAQISSRLGDVTGANLPAIAILEDVILPHTYGTDTTSLEAYVAGLITGSPV